MQEKQVSIGGKTNPLPQPFYVLATQNTMEQEGTYALPEAQQDRFMLSVMMTYLPDDQEAAVVRQSTGAGKVELRPRVGPRGIAGIRGGGARASPCRRPRPVHRGPGRGHSADGRRVPRTSSRNTWRGAPARGPARTSP